MINDSTLPCTSLNEQSDRHRPETDRGQDTLTDTMGPKDVSGSLSDPPSPPQPLPSFNIHKPWQSRQLVLWQRAGDTASLVDRQTDEIRDTGA